MNHLIVVLDDLGEEAVSLLQNSPYDISFDIKDLPQANAILTRSTKITESMILSAPNLKIISRAGVGMDNIDVEFAHTRGVFTFNAKGGNAVNAAETTMGFIISLAHKITYAHHLLYGQKKWERGLLTEGFELEGKTLGIIGCGDVGSRVAHFAHAFNMNILVYDPYQSNIPAFAKPVKDLKNLLAESDLITLHTPLNKETMYMIDEKEFSYCKKSAYLINASRGNVVRESALIKAIKTQQIAGVALDVFNQEPLPENSELYNLENIIMIPHLGGAGIECRKRVSRFAVENVLNKLQEL